MLNLNVLMIFLNIHIFEPGTIFFAELKYDDDYFVIIEGRFLWIP